MPLDRTLLIFSDSKMLSLREVEQKPEDHPDGMRLRERTVLEETL